MNFGVSAYSLAGVSDYQNDIFKNGPVEAGIKAQLAILFTIC